MSESKIEITTTQNVSKQNYLPWLIWGLGCVFYFYECLLQVSPSVISNELMRDFSISGHALGILVGFYFYSYAAMQLPAGLALDYFGPRRLLSIATLVCACSTIAFGLTTNFYMACIARLMIGLGSAFAAIGTMKLAANWFPSEKFAFTTGLMVTLGMLGAIFGEAPLAILVDTYGWRESMIIMGIIGLALVALILLIVKDNPKFSESGVHPHPVHHEKLFASLLTLIRNKQLWLVATYGGLMYMSTPVFCGLWGVPFLMTKLHITKVAAANFIILVFVGWAIASPLWGIFSNRIGLRKPPLYIGSVGAMTCLGIVILTPLQNELAVEVLLFLFGIFSAAFLPAFAVAKEICDKDYVATGLSFMNMMNMIGIAVLQPVIGFILDFFWKGDMEKSVRIYSVADYQMGLLLLPLGMLIALLLLSKIKETHCQSVR